MDNPAQYRQSLTQMLRQYPALFPKDMDQDFTFHDAYVSVKHDLIVRRIQLKATGAVFALRPSFVMPSMIARTEEVEKALSLRQWGVPFDALAYVFGRDARCWYRAWLAFGRPSLLGTTVTDPQQVPTDLVADEQVTWVAGQAVDQWPLISGQKLDVPSEHAKMLPGRRRHDMARVQPPREALAGGQGPQRLDFPGVALTCTSEVLIVRSQQPLEVLSSAEVGGGFVQTRTLLNRHVHRDYNCAEPAADLVACAREHGITGTFVGLMTAVSLQKAQTMTVRADSLTVAAVVTAGISNTATPGLSPPATSEPGTINLILLIDAQLSPAAMVNAVITATEVKTQVLMAQGIRTPEGHPATGTSTDAIAVACTGRGTCLSYAGPVTLVGWLIGRCVHTALEDALAQG